ncbi:MAG TPA: oligosaccharide flippase family protein [Candidatus Sulfotelmatobacter sp.]|nr:oligosaccharide flippase family protein [Candidatus Sulfotelmatobacter sp.]
MASSSLPDTTEWKADSDLLVSRKHAADSEDSAQTPAAGVLGRELKTLARESSHYMAGLLGNVAVGFVSFPIFTRLLSISEYGLMDLGQRLLLMLTIASKLGLQNASLRFYNRKEFSTDPAAGRNYYSTLFFGMLGSSCSIVVLCLLVVSLLPKTSTFGPLATLIYLILGLVVLRAMGAILWGFLRIEERTKTFNVITVATRATTVAAVCALLPWMGRSAHTYFTGVVSVETILVLVLSAWLLQRGVLNPSHFKFDLFRAAIAYGTPLVLYEFAFAVLGSADRFLVRHYVGADALGFYSVAYGLANNVNEMLVSPLGLALIPIYMRIWASDGAEKTSAFVSTSFNIFIMAAAGVLAAIAATGHSIVVLLASAKYAGADRLIPVILAGLLVYGANVFVAAGLLIHKRTSQMSGLLVIAAALNIALNCLLLPRMGLMGGAIATLLSYLTCILSLAWASNRILPLHTDVKTCMKYVGSAAFAWVIVSRFTFGSAIFDLLAKSALVFSVYLIALYIVDSRTRDSFKQALHWIQTQC